MQLRHVWLIRNVAAGGVITVACPAALGGRGGVGLRD
jgi:hypothetical protein